MLDLFDSTSEGIVDLKAEMMKGMSQELAVEIIEWMEKTQEAATRPRTCELCGTPA